MKYTIRKGKHFANFTINRLFPFACKKLSGSVIFDSNCLVPGEVDGWNKLTGITSFKIHKNSGRLVWKSFENRIQLAGYVYYKGVRNWRTITEIPHGTWFGYSVEYIDKHWRFTVNGKTIVMNGEMGFCKFRCYPFYGGQSKAPARMVIKLK